MKTHNTFKGYYFYTDVTNYSNKNTIQLFIDITTVCNLTCSYCFARKDKVWDEVLETDKIKKIMTLIKQSPYDFNILLFGGEPLLHKDIKEIIETVQSSPKVKNVMILSNGTLADGLYNFKDVFYCLTLHEISDNQLEKFIKHCDEIDSDKLKINLPLNVYNSALENAYKTLVYEGFKDNIFFSVIYDDDTKNIIPLDDVKERLNYIDFNVDVNHTLNGSQMSYMDFLEVHLTLDPSRDVEQCYINELNIDINGDISNDCMSLESNVYNDIFFFKHFRLGYKCTKTQCKDCTGTITCAKDFKEQYD